MEMSQNWIGEWDLEQAHAHSEHTVLVHGKHWKRQ
jgi:hypothetical protein